MVANPLVPEKKYGVLPYDSYCPSLKTKVQQRVCKNCDIYYPSIAALKRHFKFCSGKELEIGESDGEEEGPEEVENDEAPVINIFDMLTNSPFIEDEE